MVQKLLFCSIKILFFLYIFLSKFSKGSNLYFNYINAITLNNENIFVIHKNGVSICDPSFSEIINESYIFDNSEKISNETALSKVIIKKFEDGYVFCIIINKIYIFDSNGQFEYKEGNIQTDSYFTLATHNITENRIYYFLIVSLSNDKAILDYYKYDASIKNIEKVTSITKEEKTLILFDYITLEIKSISCEIMKENKIICMYYYTNIFNYYTLLNLEITKKSNKITLNIEENENLKSLKVDCFKSTVNQNKTKAIFCLYTSDGVPNCIFYDINSKKIAYYDISKKTCRTKPYSLKVHYFHDKEEFVFSCITTQRGIQINTFKQNSKGIEHKTNQFYTIDNNCSNIYGHSILFHKESEQYFVLYDAICRGISQSNKIIIEEEKEKEREKEREKKKEEKEEEEEKEEKEEEKEEKEEKEEEKEEKEEEKEEKEEKEEEKEEKEEEEEKEEKEEETEEKK
jgi:hypothetical protein